MKFRIRKRKKAVKLISKYREIILVRRKWRKLIYENKAFMTAAVTRI